MRSGLSLTVEGLVALGGVGLGPPLLAVSARGFLELAELEEGEARGVGVVAPGRASRHLGQVGLSAAGGPRGLAGLDGGVETEEAARQQSALRPRAAGGRRGQRLRG
jgi:hypothetical protein